MSKENRIERWRDYLGNLFADYTNGIDSQADLLRGGTVRRLATMEERYIFDLWYFWACAGCQISRCRSVKAHFSSRRFRDYTDNNTLMCNWWNSLNPGDKNLRLLDAFKELHRTNTRNVFEGRPFQWSETLPESLVRSVEIQPQTITTYGPETLLVYAEHSREPESEKALQQAVSILDKKGFTFEKMKKLSDCMQKEFLVLPWQAKSLVRSVSKNLKRIIFVNEGSECLDGKREGISYGIRLLRQRLDFLDLKRVRLLDMSPSRNIPGCEKIESQQLEEHLEYF